MATLHRCKTCLKILINSDDYRYFDEEMQIEQWDLDKEEIDINNIKCDDCGTSDCWLFWDGKELPGNPFCPKCLSYHVDYEMDGDSITWHCKVCKHTYPDSEYDNAPGCIRAGSIDEVIEKIKEVCPDVQVAGPIKIKRKEEP